MSVAVDTPPLIFQLMVSLKHPRVMIRLPTAVQSVTSGRKAVPGKCCSYTDSGMASRSAPASGRARIVVTNAWLGIVEL